VCIVRNGRQGGDRGERERKRVKKNEIASWGEKSGIKEDGMRGRTMLLKILR